jgi:hypothetical protein
MKPDQGQQQIGLTIFHLCNSEDSVKLSNIESYKRNLQCKIAHLLGLGDIYIYKAAVSQSRFVCPPTGREATLCERSDQALWKS